jgi:hypothetical protein
MLTYYSMNNLNNNVYLLNLPDEVLLQIASYLDIFHIFQFAHTSQHMRLLLYNSNLQSQIDEYFLNLKQLKMSSFRFIKRINTDGVVYGECEQCSRNALLYTQFDGENERCICLDYCVSYNVQSGRSVRFHHRVPII